jgi:hypothetical protein
LAAVAAAALLVPAASAVGWSSNVFQSPSGNIVCRYDQYNVVMACLTLNDNFTAAVPLYGRAYKTRGGTFRRGPVLSYGSSWTSSGRFRCTSSAGGITCRSLRTGHGFFISRTSYRLF